MQYTWNIKTSKTICVCVCKACRSSGPSFCRRLTSPNWSRGRILRLPCWLLCMHSFPGLFNQNQNKMLSWSMKPILNFKNLLKSCEECPESPHNMSTLQAQNKIKTSRLYWQKELGFCGLMQVVEWSSSAQKVGGLMPCPCSLYVSFLEQVTEPQIACVAGPLVCEWLPLLMSSQHCYSDCSHCDQCMNGWMQTCGVNGFEWSKWVEMWYINTVHLILMVLLK